MPHIWSRVYFNKSIGIKKTHYLIHLIKVKCCCSTPYLIFLSLLRRKRPRMLMAKTWKKKRKNVFVLKSSRYTQCLILWSRWTYPQSTLWLDVHNCKDCLIQDCISYIFTCFCVCGHLQVRGCTEWVSDPKWWKIVEESKD